MLLFIKKYQTILFYLALFGLMMFMSINDAHAAWYDDLLNKVKSSGSNVATIFANFDMSGRVFIAIIKYLAVIVGIILAIISCVMFVRASDGKEQVSNGFYALFASIFLVSFVPSIDLLSNTMGMSDANVGLAKACTFTFQSCANDINSLSAYAKAGLVGVITFIRVVGYLAFFRGVYGIFELAKNRQGGGVWKSLMFMIGGVACINVITTALLFGNTLAPNSNFVDFIHDQELIKAVK